MTRVSFGAAIDTARIGACFMVVVLHVAAVNFHVFDSQWFASNFYDSLTRSCVPLFLMISGVLLLGKDEALPVFFRKRFARILPPLLFWSLFYMGWNTWQGEGYGNWIGWVAQVLSGPATFHLWYLYAIVGIYLFLPFLSRIWSASGPGERKLYLALWALASAWPIIQTVFKLDVDILMTYDLGSFFGLAGYLFLGAYVHEVYQRQTDRRCYWWTNLALFVLFSSLTMIATHVSSQASGEPQTLFYDYLSPFVVASSVCAFNVLYGAGSQIGRYSKGLQKISACTLGVYCVHIFVMQQVELFTGQAGAAYSSWWTIPLTAVLVFAVSLAVILALRRFRPFTLVT